MTAELLERLAEDIEAMTAAVLALVAVLQVRKVRKGTDEINQAVNQRPVYEPKLYDLVKDTNQRVTNLTRRFDQHIGWHEARDDENHVGGDQ